MNDIIGVGIDIVKNERIKKSIKKKEFLNRVFSKYEIKFCLNKSNKASFFAKRFAAKEAFVKSIGIGFRKDINFKDIIVINNKLGKPIFKINKKIESLLKKNFKIKRFSFFLSLSDEKDYSIASVIFQKK